MKTEQLNHLCNYLNLGEPLSSPTQIFGGLLHTLWQITTNLGSYAIKQLNKNINLDKKTRNQYELTEKIAKEFYNHSSPAITSITKEGNALFDILEDTFIIFPWIAAKTVENLSIHPPHATKIATILAKMHNLNLKVPRLSEAQYDYHSNEYINLLIEKSIFQNLPFAEELKYKLSFILKINNDYQKSIPILIEYSVVSHGDLDPKNVLWNEQNEPFLIDWESSKLLNPNFEILNAALDWSGISTNTFNLEIFTSMIKGYKEEGASIDQNIKPAFYNIFGNWLNWMIYNIEMSLKTEKCKYSEQVHQTLNTINNIEEQLPNLINLIPKIH